MLTSPVYSEVAFSATLSNPNVTSPTEGAALDLGNVAVKWQKVSRAAYYTIAVQDTTANALIVSTTNVGTSTSYTISSSLLTKGHSYLISVSSNATGSTAGLTKRNFSIKNTLAGPNVTSPTEGAALDLGNVAVNWQSVSGAANYTIAVQDTTANALIVSTTNVGTGTSYTISSSLLTKGHSYLISVSSNATGATAGLTERNFSIKNTLAGPNVTSPTEGEALDLGNVAVKWQSVSGAANYTIAVRDTTTNAMIVSTTNVGTGTSYTISSSLLTKGHSYRISVSSNATGATAGLTERNFSIKNTLISILDNGVENLKYKGIPLLPENVPSPINYTSKDNYKTNLDLIFEVSDTGNMQGLTYYDGYFYIGFDQGSGNGKILKYTKGGKLEKDSGSLALGHCAELAYRKANHNIYVANGGGTSPAHIYEIDMTAATPSILDDFDFAEYGNAALVAIDNDNDRMILHTAADDFSNPTFRILQFNGTLISQFSIPFQGTPQGLDYYQGYLYYYTGNKITAIDLTGNIQTSLEISKSGESQGLTIAGDYESPFIAVGYNTPNRLYALRSPEDREYNTFSPLGPVNRRDASYNSLIPKIFTMAVNTNHGVGDWRIVEWSNGFYFDSLISSVQTNNTEITITLKCSFAAIGSMFAQGNFTLYDDGIHAAVDSFANTITLRLYDNSGNLVDPTTILANRTVKILVIGAVSVDG
jgi:HKD family nuclease